MAEQDPYEEWKAQGRPGGSFANWRTQQDSTPPPQPAPQTTAPAQAAPTQYMPNGQTAAGGGTEEQKQTARLAAGTFSDDSADAGNASTGDPYLDELRSGNVAGSEDWRRFSNAQMKAWQSYYIGNGKFRNKYGDIVDKPDDSGPNTPKGYNGTGDYFGGGGDSGGGGAGGGQGGQGGAPYVPPPPPKPVTSGNQLSMTGNPMQDMLISQFNNGVDPVTGQSNIFALGADMRPGGEGINKDGHNADRQAQSLSGGGLWWGENKDTFNGFDASQKNATGTETASPAARAAAPAPAAPTISPAQPNGPAKMGGQYVANQQRRNATYQGFQPSQSTPLAGMVQNQFGSAARNKPSYF